MIFVIMQCQLISCKILGFYFCYKYLIMLLHNKLIKPRIQTYFQIFSQQYKIQKTRLDLMCYSWQDQEEDFLLLLLFSFLSFLSISLSLSLSLALSLFSFSVFFFPQPTTLSLSLIMGKTYDSFYTKVKRSLK